MYRKILIGLLSVLLVAGLMINGCGEAAREAEEDNIASPEAGVTGIEAGANGIDYDVGGTSATLYTLVVDQNDNPVTNLLSGNVEVSISYSGSAVITDDCTVVNVHNKAGTPAENISIALALDQSGSMGEDQTDPQHPEPLASLQTAAKNFIALMKANDEAAVIAFDVKATRTEPMKATTDTGKALLKEEVDWLWPGGDTALYDAIALSVDEAYEYGSKPRKIVLAMTDGGENNSYEYPYWESDPNNGGQNYNNLIAYANDRSIPVYIIGLSVSDIEDENANGTSDERELKEIAAGTGGLYYPALTKEDLSGLYSKFSNALNNYYNVTVTSPVAFQTGKTYTMTFRVINYGSLTAISTYTFKVP